LPSDSETWQCTQTLELKSSAEPRPEEAFFNQVVVLPRASLILLANAKKNAIYAVHVDYGPFPASTRMDYIADFTVTMPILSLTGTSDSLPDGEQVVQVYCVQTQAIQQYALDLYQCLPPPVDALLGRDSGIRVFDAPSSDGFAVFDPSRGPTVSAFPVSSASPKTSLPGSSSDTVPTTVYPISSVPSEVSGIHERTTSNVEVKPSAPPLSSSDATTSVPLPAPLNMDLSGGLSILRNTSKGFEQGPSLSDRDVSPPVEPTGRVDSVTITVPDVSSAVDNSGKDKSKAGMNDNNLVPNSHLMFKLGGNTTHLVTPSEILSGAISSSENIHVNQGPRSEEVKVQDTIDNNDVKSVNVEVKHVDESRLGQPNQCDSQKEPQVVSSDKDKSVNTPTSEVSNETLKEVSPLTSEICSVDELPRGDDISAPDTLEQPSIAGEEEVQENPKDLPEKATESVTTMSQSASGMKGKRQKAKQSQASAPSSPSLSPFNSTDSLNEPGSSAGLLSTDIAFSQLHSMQDMLNQVRLVCAVHRCYIVLVCIIEIYYLFVMNNYLYQSCMVEGVVVHDRVF